MTAKNLFLDLRQIDANMYQKVLRLRRNLISQSSLLKQQYGMNMKSLLAYFTTMKREVGGLRMKSL